MANGCCSFSTSMCRYKRRREEARSIPDLCRCPSSSTNPIFVLPKSKIKIPCFLTSTRTQRKDSILFHLSSITAMVDAVGDNVNRIPQQECLSRRLSTVNSLSLRDLLEENNPSSQPESNHHSNKTMNVASLNRRLSTVNSLSLRDILEESNPSSQPEESNYNNKKTMTLAAVLATSNPTSPPPSSSSTRTLLDIIDDENQLFHPTDTESIAQHVNWKSFKDRLLLRRATSAFSSSEPPNQTLEVDNPTTPRVSLMSLLEQTDRMAEIEEEERKSTAVIAAEEEEVVVEGEMVHVCCVCMVRHKGAAFIPCGHTFCRLCSRELWVSRGNCPLCNGFILEILDIF